MVSQESARVRTCKNIRKQIYDPSLFPHAIYEKEIFKLLSSEVTMIDIGCGREAKYLRMFASKVKKAYGLDLEISETIVDGNLEIMQGNAKAIPLQDDSVDVVTMCDVVEHLQYPEQVFSECKRVLKKGGSLIILTPNKFYPPIFFGLALPHFIRKWANSIITSTKEENTFPAYYKSNTAREFYRLGNLIGLNIVSIRFLAFHPQYYMFSVFIYRIMVVFERFFLNKEIFACFRHSIFCHYVKD